jgi:outer membrane protein OmpA-like peptidoglycan-associated protein
MSKKIFFQAICLILSMAGTMSPVYKAQAQEIGSLGYYGVPKSEYYDAGTGQYKPEYYQWKLFLEYNLHREQCQHYQDPPAGYVVKGCQVYPVEQPVASIIPPVAPDIAPAAAAALPEKSYEPVTIYFNFDKSDIRHGENEKLNLIIDRIAADNPARVIIAGHTDTAGPVDYNVWLSRRRAKVVADALAARGIQKEIIEQKAYGKTDLAVPTADNVPLQENRRTIVIFVQ